MTTDPQEDTQALLAQAEYYDEQAKRQSIQPSQAKDKAVADLTAACYQKASQLKLSREEIEALKLDFGDDAFQPGAAGKENLIYIEHAALRERLDNVIGMGQWVMIPIRRWVEEFTYEKDEWINNKRTGNTIPVKGSHVYVDAIMVIRECFVASAIGEMTYYPDNHTQNYGDAVEGAETAALRRCCKRLGIGLQAWRKDWCLGWWTRRNAQKRTPARTEPTKPPQNTTLNQKAPSTAGTLSAVPVDKARLKALHNLLGSPGEANQVMVHDFLVAKGWIKPTQLNMDWPAEHVPLTAPAFTAIKDEIQAYHEQRAQSDLAEEMK